MKSYIKIIGPPLHEAILALQSISKEMPLVTHREVFTETKQPDFTDIDASRDFFMNTHLQDYPIYRNNQVNIIKNGKAVMGDYDFIFEWVQKPTVENIIELVKRIDEEFSRLGSQYMMSTK
jgi:hypothetical protein